MFGYDETRGFIKRKLLAFVLTLGAIVFLAVTITPGCRDARGARRASIDLPEVRGALEAGRWMLLLGALVLSIGVLLRIAPDRPDDPPRLIGKGVLIASAMWVLVSVGFSLYVDNFGNYGETYGALAGVVVLQLWLWIGIYALLLGSAIEAVREHAPLEEEAAEVMGLVGANQRMRSVTSKTIATTATTSRMTPLTIERSNVSRAAPVARRGRPRSPAAAAAGRRRRSPRRRSGASSSRTAGSMPGESSADVVPTSLTSSCQRSPSRLPTTR